MQIFKLKDFTKGWVVGDFEPTILKTPAFEFGVKKYKAGDGESAHFHKKADEVSVIVCGKFKMNGKILEEGDVVLMRPNEVADFSCIEDGYTAVVKTPGAKDDKYLA